MIIQQLPLATISQLCTSVALQNLHSFVKELVENSIDGGSRNISITFHDSGRAGLDVSDDGHGIAYAECRKVATKGGTSKLQQWTDMQDVATLGFRGEALNAISQLATLRLTTRHKDDEMGWTKNYTTGEVGVVAKDQGTTIMVSDLFRTLPVRRLDFERTYKSQYNRSFNLLTEYAIIHPQIQFKVWNHEPPKLKSQVFHSGPHGTFEERVLHTLGKKLFDCLSELNVTTPTYQIKGYISKSVDSGSVASGTAIKKNIWYCYVNHRPIDAPKALLSMISAVYRQYNPNGRFMFVLDFILSNPADVDFNVSVDKREVFILNLDALITTLEAHIMQLLDLGKGIPKMIHHEPIIKKEKIKMEDAIHSQPPLLKIQEVQNTTNSKSKTKHSGFLQQLQTNQRVKVILEPHNQAVATITHDQPQTNTDDQQPAITHDELCDEVAFDEFGYRLHQDALQFADQVFQKHHFLQLTILGQYNKGFMVCLHRGQILILDQHACDEKRTYESLLGKFCPHSTTLIHPFTLGLQGWEIDLASQHQPKLNELGYRFKIIDAILSLTSLPSYGKHTFSPDTFQSVLHKLSEGETATNHLLTNLLPRVKQIIAMQACRSSIMIGHVLTPQNMRQLCDGMAVLQAPWNCPHGRPTFVRASQHLTATMQQLAPERGFSASI